eukprot:g1359.t1
MIPAPDLTPFDVALFVVTFSTFLLYLSQLLSPAPLRAPSKLSLLWRWTEMQLALAAFSRAVSFVTFQPGFQSNPSDLAVGISRLFLLYAGLNITRKKWFLLRGRNRTQVAVRALTKTIPALLLVIAICLTIAFNLGLLTLRQSFKLALPMSLVTPAIFIGISMAHIVDATQPVRPARTTVEKNILFHVVVLLFMMSIVAIQSVRLFSMRDMAIPVSVPLRTTRALTSLSFLFLSWLAGYWLWREKWLHQQLRAAKTKPPQPPFTGNPAGPISFHFSAAAQSRSRDRICFCRCTSFWSKEAWFVLACLPQRFRSINTCTWQERTQALVLVRFLLLLHVLTLLFYVYALSSASALHPMLALWLYSLLALALFRAVKRPSLTLLGTCTILALYLVVLWQNVLNGSYGYVNHSMPILYMYLALVTGGCSWGCWAALAYLCNLGLVIYLRICNCYHFAWPVYAASPDIVASTSFFSNFVPFSFLLSHHMTAQRATDRDSFDWKPVLESLHRNHSFTFSIPDEQDRGDSKVLAASIHNSRISSFHLESKREQQRDSCSEQEGPEVAGLEDYSLHNHNHNVVHNTPGGPGTPPPPPPPQQQPDVGNTLFHGRTMLHTLQQQQPQPPQQQPEQYDWAAAGNNNSPVESFTTSVNSDSKRNRSNHNRSNNRDRNRHAAADSPIELCSADNNGNSDSSGSGSTPASFRMSYDDGGTSHVVEETSGEKSLADEVPVSNVPHRPPDVS